MNNHASTREEWLNEVKTCVTAQLFEPVYEVPANVRVSCGFPSARGLNGVKNQRIGECWGDTSSKDKHFEIFISPTQDDPIEVAAILVHELCHTVAGIKAKHGPVFKKVAVHVGLEGKMTATTASDALKVKLLDITGTIGDYPMAALDARAMERTTKKQGTRYIKCECPHCGYTARVVNKWLTEKGAPHCPEHGAMDMHNPEEE